MSNPGTCITSTGEIATDIQATAVLRKSQNFWYDILEVVGPNASGTWSVNTVKLVNGATVSDGTSSDTYPSGWALSSGRVERADRGIVTFNAQASNTAPTGIQCQASITIRN